MAPRKIKSFECHNVRCTHAHPPTQMQALARENGNKCELKFMKNCENRFLFVLDFIF